MHLPQWDHKLEIKDSVLSFTLPCSKELGRDLAPSFITVTLHSTRPPDFISPLQENLPSLDTPSERRLWTLLPTSDSSPGNL